MPDSRFLRSAIALFLMLAMQLASLPGRAAPAEQASLSGQAPEPVTTEENAIDKTGLPDDGTDGEWKYTARPTDTIWSIAQDYLGDHKTWLDLVRYNHLKSPKDMPPGTVLRIPIAWLKIQPAPAVAVAVNGEALLKRSTQPNWAPLEQNQFLNVGDTIRTLEGSVLIRFADSSVLRLAPHGTLIFNRLSQFGKTGMTDTRLRLEKGRVSTKVNPLKIDGSRYEISTPSAVAAVRGTAFRVEVDEEGTLLEVTEGVVQLRSGQSTQDVSAGHSARVNATGRQSPATPLLPQPLRGKVPARVDHFPVALSWQPVKHAASYAYEIYQGDNEQTLVRQGQTEHPDLTLNHLPNGDYTLHFMAVDASGARGLADIQRIHVQVSAKPATPIAPEDDAQFIDKQPLFRWTPADPSQSTQLQVADNLQFDPLITQSEWTWKTQEALDILLPPGRYYWRLVSRAGPEEKAFSKVRAFTVMQTLPEAQVLSINYIGDTAKVFWKRVPNATRYTVQLAREGSFTQIEQTYETEDTHISVKLQPGVLYFLRVIASPNTFYKASTSRPIQIELTR